MELVFLAILVLVMATALASGYPVAFALPGSAIITIGLASAAGYLFAGDASAYFASGGPIQWLSAGVTNFRGVYWEVERDTLIAIPLFVFMGIMLQRSKIAEDLLVAMAQLFGPVPGGLGISVVFVGALLAATTGILGATVVAMGLISLPVMMRNGYSNALSTGTIAASGTLGQIIPPSIVLIILADQLASAVDQADTARKAFYKSSTGSFSMPSDLSVASTSAGDMFLGALVPGLLLVGIYMVYILVYSLIWPASAPSVKREGAYDWAFIGSAFFTLIPPLALIFIVLGSIIMGIATVNQAGAIGAVGATVMAGYRLRAGKRGAFIPAILALGSLIAIGVITSLYSTNIKGDGDPFGITLAVIAVVTFLFAIGWSGWRTFKIEDTLRGVMLETAKTTSLVFIILLGAAMLTAAFRAFGGEELVRHFLTSLPGGFWAQFVMVMAVIFVLGFFLDFIEISVVVVPIVAPILLMDPSANVTAVWLGVMIGLNIQTSFLTPPFGFALFYLRGVAPKEVKTIEMYKGVVPFIVLQLIGLFVVGLTPQLVNYLPQRISLLSDTAPPPINPRLQVCLQESLFPAYKTRESELRAAMSVARKLNVSFVPSELKSDFTSSIPKAEKTFDLVRNITRTQAALTVASKKYLPLHVEVRAIQKKMATLNKEGRDLRQVISRSRRDKDLSAALRTERKARVIQIDEEIKSLRASIPARWKGERKTFVTVQRASTAAHRKYQRNVDQAYEPVRELMKVIASTDALSKLQDEITGLDGVINNLEPKKAELVVKALSIKMNKISGSRKISRHLRNTRRALRKRSPDRSRALKALASANSSFEKEMAWRRRAQSDLLPGLMRYEEAIRDTIGLRLQPHLSRSRALEIAACRSYHRDMTLRF